MAKNPKKKSKGGELNSGTEDQVVYAPIPLGVKAEVREFGAAAPADNVVVLEWGSGSDWEIVHAITGYAHVGIRQDFEGDGAKAFRVTRYNDSNKKAKSFYWLDWLEK